ncbi:MAG: sigma-70 family RNA polymerase sigma factor [Bacteroidota bacterium]
MAQPAPIISINTEEQIRSFLTENDERAIPLIFNHYGVAMLNTINRVVKDECLAEDVFQKVMVKIWERGRSYNAAKGSLFTWLIRISKNAAIDETRSKEFIRDRKSNSIDNFVFNDGAIHQKKTQERNEGVWETVHLLPESQRLLIDMAYFQGFTQKEIAEELNMPLGTVKTRMRSALSLLRSLY